MHSELQCQSPDMYDELNRYNIARHKALRFLVPNDLFAQVNNWKGKNTVHVLQASRVMIVAHANLSFPKVYSSERVKH